MLSSTWDVSTDGHKPSNCRLPRISGCLNPNPPYLQSAGPGDLLTCCIKTLRHQVMAAGRLNASPAATKPPHKDAITLLKSAATVQRTGAIDASFHGSRFVSRMSPGKDFNDSYDKATLLQ